MGGTIDPAETIREVIAALDALGIAYALGGSMASSIHGIARFTLDADLTAEPFPGKEEHFAHRFGPDYYLSVDAIRQANANRSSFNIINTNLGFKVDIFIRKERPFEQSLMSRRVRYTPPDAPGSTIQIVSAEDIILLKLEWFRLGGEVSDRQWTDIQNVLKVQAGRLDDAYLDHWAADLGVGDLLRRARDEAGAS